MCFHARFLDMIAKLFPSWRAIFFLALLIRSTAFGARGPSLGKITEIDLNRLHWCLEQVSKNCGRYPDSNEGLKAILHAPIEMKCTNSALPKEWECVLLNKGSDGWRTSFKYESDGKSYRIEASHGYSMSNLSPKHGEREDWWENPAGGDSPAPLNFETWAGFVEYLLAAAAVICAFAVRARIAFYFRAKGQFLAERLLAVLIYAVIFIFILFTYFQLSIRI